MTAPLATRLRPAGRDLVDLAFAVVLSVLGVVGFRTVFAGAEELTVGIPAVLAGAALGYVLVRLRIPLLVSAAVAVVAFFVLGGPIALRHRAFAGFLPSPDAASGLADGVVNGWMRLLTTLPPAGSAGDLLAVPYVSGFAGGLLAVALARRYPTRAFCVLPPVAVLAVSVLMGTKRPASLLLQGVVFAAVTIAWIAVRHQRQRAVNQVRVSRGRALAATGLLALSAAGGVVVGPRLPGADPADRYVLREEVEPPFDPLTEPSPLAGYRNYTDQDVREDEVLTVRGLPDGARLRIAAMDRYSGTEWEATGSGTVVAGEYLRVGAEIPAEGRGTPATVDVVVHKPHGVWVPLGGDVPSLRFRGDRAAALDDEVRVSIETDTAALPGRLAPGDRYRFTAEFVDLPDAEVLLATPLDPRFERGDGDDDVPQELLGRAADWARNQATPFAEMWAIAKGLRTEGAYTDGGPEANPVSPPGHSLRRLLDFIALEQPFGNGEQFAAAQGLMAQALGVPVRVVMGFVNEGGEDEVTFRGEDIEAWIEVPVAGYGWVAVDGTPPE
ncbi:MAG: transglutaminase-like domain-containing protein, partial [Actinomycetota bacterium]